MDNEKQDGSEKLSWSGPLHTLMNKVEANQNISMSVTNPNAAGQKIESYLKNQYVEYSTNKLNEATQRDSRLTFYGSIADGKQQHKIETYLTLGLPVTLSKPITQIRTGCHCLPIATGRYHKPPTKTKDRFCSLCPNKIGNECHFLLHCPINEAGDRKKLMEMSGIDQPLGPESDTTDYDQAHLARYLLSPTNKAQAIFF